MARHIIPAQLRDESDFVLTMGRHRIEDAESIAARQVWLYTFQRIGTTAPLFTGEDFRTPRMMEEGAAKLELVAWLTLKPGDTDSEWFDAYTPEQMKWAESYSCEALAGWVLTEEEQTA